MKTPFQCWGLVFSAKTKNYCMLILNWTRYLFQHQSSPFNSDNWSSLHHEKSHGSSYSWTIFRMFYFNAKLVRYLVTERYFDLSDWIVREKVFWQQRIQRVDSISKFKNVHQNWGRRRWHRATSNLIETIICLGTSRSCEVRGRIWWDNFRFFAATSSASHRC